MKKIRKFRLKISTWTVERKLKKNNYQEVGSSLKETITRKIDEAEKVILPTTIYDTCKPEEILPLLITEELKSSLASSFALTVFAITLSKKCEFREQISEPLIFQAIIDGALEQAVRFISRLVNLEAKEEGCLIGMGITLTEEKEVNIVKKLLGIKKEDLGSELLGFRVGIIPWLAKKRGKEEKKNA